jgi:hypothetical protein
MPGDKELLERTDLSPVPSDSKAAVALEISDLLASRGADRFPEYDAKLLLSAVWRKHAGNTYHMRWGADGEIEVILGDVMKIRLEKMKDGVRLRFLRL